MNANIAQGSYAVSVIGSQGVGKTALLQAIAKQEFDQEDETFSYAMHYQQTSVEYVKKLLNKNSLTEFSFASANLIDAFDNVDAIVYCFAINDAASLQAIVQFFTNNVVHFEGKTKRISEFANIPVLLCGCKADLRNTTACIDKEQIVQLAKQFKARTYVEFAPQTHALQMQQLVLQFATTTFPFVPPAAPYTSAMDQYIEKVPKMLPFQFVPSSKLLSRDLKNGTFKALLVYGTNVSSIKNELGQAQAESDDEDEDDDATMTFDTVTLKENATQVQIEECNIQQWNNHTGYHAVIVLVSVVEASCLQQVTWLIQNAKFTVPVVLLGCNSGNSDTNKVNLLQGEWYCNQAGIVTYLEYGNPSFLKDIIMYATATQ